MMYEKKDGPITFWIRWIDAASRRGIKDFRVAFIILSLSEPIKSGSGIQGARRGARPSGRGFIRKQVQLGSMMLGRKANRIERWGVRRQTESYPILWTEDNSGEGPVCALTSSRFLESACLLNCPSTGGLLVIRRKKFAYDRSGRDSNSARQTRTSRLRGCSNALSDAVARQNHVIFGRRGCGKTSPSARIRKAC